MTNPSKAEIVAVAPCPTCRAMRGQQCRGRKGEPRPRSHQDRQHLAQLWTQACWMAGENPLDPPGDKPARAVSNAGAT